MTSLDAVTVSCWGPPPGWSPRLWLCLGGGRWSWEAEPGTPETHQPSQPLLGPPHLPHLLGPMPSFPGLGHDLSWTFLVLSSGWESLWETPGSFPWAAGGSGLCSPQAQPGPCPGPMRQGSGTQDRQGAACSGRGWDEGMMLRGSGPEGSPGVRSPGAMQAGVALAPLPLQNLVPAAPHPQVSIP